MRAWIKEIREEHGLTIREMAECLDLRFDIYEMMENGMALDIPIMVGTKIADNFNMPLSRQVAYEQEYLRRK